MFLDDTQIEELQTILKEDFGVECSKEVATEVGTNYVRYIETLADISNSYHEAQDDNS